MTTPCHRCHAPSARLDSAGRGWCDDCTATHMRGLQEVLRPVVATLEAVGFDDLAREVRRRARMVEDELLPFEPTQAELERLTYE